MGAVKVPQIPSAPGSPPADVCTACRPMDAGAADDAKQLPANGGEQTAQSLSDQSTEYAFVSDEEEDLLDKKQEGTSLTEMSGAATPRDSPQSAEAEFSPMASPSTLQEAATCIIFDWDDTLLPTSFLGDVARVNSVNQFLSAGMAASMGISNPMEPASCQRAVKQHADLVRRVLTFARGLGHVAIVTSSVRPWVDRSAEQHLPGLDVAQLLSDLGIPVLYAPECWTPSMDSMSGLEAYTACKRAVMQDFVESVCRDGRGLKHAISIGDSPVERDAMMQVVQYWQQPVDVLERPLCKTVKFMPDPSLRQLHCELEHTMAWLERIVAHGLDADVIVDPWDDIASKLSDCFGPCPDSAH